jgi:hypothetical protein
VLYETLAPPPVDDMATNLPVVGLLVTYDQSVFADKVLVVHTIPFGLVIAVLDAAATVQNTFPFQHIPIHVFTVPMLLIVQSMPFILVTAFARPCDTEQNTFPFHASCLQLLLVEIRLPSFQLIPSVLIAEYASDAMMLYTFPLYAAPYQFVAVGSVHVFHVSPSAVVRILFVPYAGNTASVPLYAPVK